MLVKLSGGPLCSLRADSNSTLKRAYQRKNISRWRGRNEDGAHTSLTAYSVASRCEKLVTSPSAEPEWDVAYAWLWRAVLGKKWASSSSFKSRTWNA